MACCRSSGGVGIIGSGITLGSSPVRRIPQGVLADSLILMLGQKVKRYRTLGGGLGYHTSKLLNSVFS